MVVFHPQSEVVFVLEPPDEPEVPGLDHGLLATASSPAQGPVGGHQVVSRLVHQHHRPVRVQGLLVIPSNRCIYYEFNEVDNYLTKDL